MATFKALEVCTDEKLHKKWSVSLGEEVFKRFFAEGDSAVRKQFPEGSLFSPMLFGKYFDPSDAFPLWEFDADVLLAHLRSHGRSAVHWHQTDCEYVLTADLPGVAAKAEPGVYVDYGAIVEISGQWKGDNRAERRKDWRCGYWWQYGYVRRLELPQDADSKNIQATLLNGSSLELRIPRLCSNPSLPFVSGA